MNEQVKKTKLHYAWIVLIGCCAMTSGMGLLLNTGGQWFEPVTKELGVGSAQLALYYTLCGLGMAVAAPFVGKYLSKVNIRILLTVFYIICIGAVFAMSRYTAVWQWWVSGALLGVFGCFVFMMPAAIILGNWFVKKTGLAIGIAMSFSGIAAAIANPIIAAIIPTVGWRTAYMLIAVVAAVIILPCTIFLIRFKPEDKGLLPYGVEEDATDDASAGAAAEATTGVPAKTAYRSVAFWIMFFACGLFAFLTGYGQVLPQYVTVIGLPTIIGLISSMTMIGNLIGTLGLGALSDKIGGTKTGVLGLMTVMVGFLLLIFCNQLEVAMLIGGLCYGVCLALIAVIVPIVCRGAFGSRDFNSLYATINIACNLIGAFGIVAITLIYDMGGSYVPALWAGAGVCIVIALGIVVSTGLAKKLPRE